MEYILYRRVTVITIHLYIMGKTRDPKLFNYAMTGQVLEEVMDTKYLGVTLRNDLEWSKHIAIMTNKANSK